MYFNVFGEKVSKSRYKEMLNAAKNRRELIAAGLTSRRELFKMGLLTAGGMLVAKSGLSARAQSVNGGTNQLCSPINQPASPTTRSFVEPLPIMPVAQTVASLTPTPTTCPNAAAGEVRAACHQATQLDASRFPVVPSRLYKFTQQAITVTQSPDLPQQTIWGFNDGTHAISPGPTYKANYGVPQLTRNINGLPANQNGGFDMPLAFADKVYDPTTKLLAFDLFNLDGILGDKFLVNGRIQPFFQVQPRRYRFRLLDTGPSRFYEFFLTDLNNLGAKNAFFVIGNDGNLLPNPVQVQGVRIGPAERVDVIIDFSQFAGKTVYLENRLRQINGQGPVPPQGFFPGQVECNDGNGNVLSDILPAGQGNLLLQFRVSGSAVQDGSV